mgnify:CR=1 FL=1
MGWKKLLAGVVFITLKEQTLKLHQNANAVKIIDINKLILTLN